MATVCQQERSFVCATYRLLNFEKNEKHEKCNKSYEIERRMLSDQKHLLHFKKL